MSKQDALYRDKDLIIELYNKGMPWKELCQKYNCCHGSMDWFFKKNKIEKNRQSEDFGLHEEKYGDLVDKMFLEGKLPAHIAKELGIGRFVVTGILKKRNREIINKPLIVHDDFVKKHQEVVNLYNEGFEAKDIAKKFSVCKSLIVKTLNKYGVKFRRKAKYTLNEHYFDVIDDEYKAYFLGLILADGTIYGNCFKISLQIKDFHILEEMKRYLEYDGPFYKKTYSNPRYQEQRVLQISSPYLVNQLVDKGCLHRKSWCLRYPYGKIPDHFFAHLLRGYYDGDGSICVKRDGNLGPISIVSTYKFLLDIDEIIKKHINIDTKIYLQKNGITGDWRVCRNKNKKIFLDYLYKDMTPDSLYLKRKYARYVNMFYNGQDPNCVFSGVSHTV